MASTHSLIWLTSYSVAFLVLFLLVRVMYRITSHPLAEFPGPFWAKISSIYGMTYDFSENESYIKNFPEWHRRYGNILRIFPNELHILDIKTYYEIFKPGSPFDKHPQFYGGRFSKGLFNIPSTKAAKPWKDVYQPYFSRTAIARLEPFVHDTLSTFMSKLEMAADQPDKVVDLSLAFRCLTSDTIMRYCFADDAFQSLEYEDFQSPTLIAMEEAFKTTMAVPYFPRFFNLVADVCEALPQDMLQKLVPAMDSMIWLRNASSPPNKGRCTNEIQKCHGRVENILRNGGSQSGVATVFDSWADGAVKKHDFPTPPLDLLGTDALIFHNAGTDTTATTLVIATWYVYNDQGILDKLRRELKTAIPGAKEGASVSLAKLETLPYLRAVLKESLRLSYGIPGRMPRVVPPTGATLCGKYIPGGTSISISSYSIHTNESYFKNAEMFNPDRWLEPDAGELDRTMISFSRGSRSCLGINLAMAELNLTFSSLVRRFDVAFHDLEKDDILDFKDSFIPVTKKHLTVRLNKVQQ